MSFEDNDTKLIIPISGNSYNIDRFLVLIKDEMILDKLGIQIYPTYSEDDFRASIYFRWNCYETSEVVIVNLVYIIRELFDRLNISSQKRVLYASVGNSCGEYRIRIEFYRKPTVAYAFHEWSDRQPETVWKNELRTAEKKVLSDTEVIKQCADDIINASYDSARVKKQEIYDFFNELDENDNCWYDGFIKVYTSEIDKDNIIKDFVRMHRKSNTEHSNSIREAYSDCRIYSLPGSIGRSRITLEEDGFLIDVGMIHIEAYGDRGVQVPTTYDYLDLITDTIENLRKKYSDICYEGAITIEDYDYRSYVVVGNRRDYSYTKKRILETLR